MEPGERMRTVFDYEARAEQMLAPAVWDYFAGGAGDEGTVRANRAAFERVQLLPRVLTGVRTADLGTRVLGTAVSMPILVAPTAAQGLATPEGECATARAAGAVGTLMVASTESTRRLEEIAAASGPLWLQLYLYEGERARAEALVRRAEVAGCRALVLTVDAPRWGRFDRRPLPVTPLPLRAWAGNEDDDVDLEPAALMWEDVAWLRSLTTLPLVLKGIVTPEDAQRAVESGAAGIVVSNHGGRVLDGVVASIAALPAIAAAVGGRCEVYVDGGVRRGTDALKALALGARAVLVGRPVVWGLAVSGAAGAQHVLELLRDELEHAMVMVGRPTVASIDRTLVQVV